MPIQLDAKLNAFRRSPRGFYITLEISPDSDWEDLARAPIGAAFGVAMVAYDADTGKASPGEAASKPIAELSPTGQQRGEAGKPRKPWSEMSRAQQAGILCHDPQFWSWFKGAYRDADCYDDCASAIRGFAEVSSRSQLDVVPSAGQWWDRIVAEFRQKTGQMAEMR